MPQPRLFIPATLIALSLLWGGTVLAQKAAPPKAAPAQKLGQYSLKGYGAATTLIKGTVWTIQVTGKDNKPVVAKTTLGYELTAPRIDVVMRLTDPKIDPTVIRKVTELKATGGVKIVVNQVDPAKGQNSVTTLTCDRAIYTSTLDPKDRGKVDMLGNVKSLTKDLTTNETIEQESERGTITVINRETTSIELFNGSIEAQLNEPATDKKNP